MSLREISDVLPLCYETVRRWAELALPAATALVPVRLQAEAESGDDLVLVSPRG